MGFELLECPSWVGLQNKDLLNTSLPVSHPSPVDCAQGVGYVRSQINPSIALSYLSPGLNHVTNYLQIANDGINGNQLASAWA